MSRYVYHFEQNRADGMAGMERLLGVRGAGLAEMARRDMPVPSGMTITAEASARMLKDGEVPGELFDELEAGIADLQKEKRDRDGLPLLLSLRESPPAPLPGMAGSVLNVGLDDQKIADLVDDGGEEMALACQRTFLRTWGRLVVGLNEERLERRLGGLYDDPSGRPGVDRALRCWHRGVEQLDESARGDQKPTLPDSMIEQTIRCLEAMSRRWKSPSFRAYRSLLDQERAPGMAVTATAMVFGNRDEYSGTGIAYSRDPISGKKEIRGEWLSGRQGDALVRGNTPRCGLRLDRRRRPSAQTLADQLPGVYDEIRQIALDEENEYGEARQIEFAVESGRLVVTGSRSMTRTGPAAIRIALAMVDEGLVDESEALLQVDAGRHVGQLMEQRIDDSKLSSKPVVRGGSVSSGAAWGRSVMSEAEAIARGRRGESVVLVRSPRASVDIEALEVIEAMVLVGGGVTSHVAESVRELGIPCVCTPASATVGEGSLRSAGGRELIGRGQMVTVDGTGGGVYRGRVSMIEDRRLEDQLDRLLSMAARFRRMDVRVDADTLDDIARADRFGVEGIGICRTEPMIESDRGRLMAMRRALLSGGEEESTEGTEELLRFHRHDLAQIFRVMEGRPVTVRLLDASLGRFLPTGFEERARTASALGMELDEVVRRTEALEETNPMLGLRGSRLAVVHPSLYRMQVQAIVEAARMMVDEGGMPEVEILIPRVCAGAELRRIVDRVESTIARHLHGATGRIGLDVGVCIQLPRAALIGDELATYADFSLVSTRDLTRLVWGMAREETGRFLPDYLDDELLADDPFESLDRRGVGRLVRRAVDGTRATDVEHVVGVDAGHGADVRSVRFFESLGVDYLTVEPEDVAVAQLAAAQARLGQRRPGRRKEAARR